MNPKSDTCVGRKTGKPLTEFASQSDAREGAAHANKRYGQNLLPYQCDECGMWHLAPADRQTPSTTCNSCPSADGKPKESYQNESAARRRADILHREQGVTLQVYACEHGNGWHLTRRFR